MKVVIISGYFNPLHGGHLDMIEAATAIGDKLIVIVNNDKQAVLKKGKVILDQNNRMRLVSALRDVDRAFLSVDTDLTVIESLKEVFKMYPDDEIIFGNGGDRDSNKVVPEAEVCEELGIKMVYNLGKKVDSSTRINKALGHE